MSRIATPRRITVFPFESWTRLPCTRSQGRAPAPSCFAPPSVGGPPPEDPSADAPPLSELELPPELPEPEASEPVSPEAASVPPPPLIPPSPVSEPGAFWPQLVTATTATPHPMRRSPWSIVYLCNDQRSAWVETTVSRVWLCCAGHQSARA